MKVQFNAKYKIGDVVEVNKDDCGVDFRYERVIRVEFSLYHGGRKGVRYLMGDDCASLVDENNIIQWVGHLPFEDE